MPTDLLIERAPRIFEVERYLLAQSSRYPVSTDLHALIALGLPALNFAPE